MSIDKEVVLQKLRELEVYTSELRRLGKYPMEEMSKSLEKAWAVEHGLQLAIQIVIDVGNHILSALGENRIQDYTDIAEHIKEYLRLSS